MVLHACVIGAQGANMLEYVKLALFVLVVGLVLGTVIGFAVLGVLAWVQ